MWQEEVSRLEEAVLDVLWAQWAAVGASAASGKRPRSVIDPEALVLASLAFRAREHRVWDQLAWWAAEGSNLLSVQRTRNLLDAYPSQVARSLGEFAGLAYEAGDHRWKSLDRHEPTQSARPGKVQGGSVRFIEASTMMLRLRLGLGVGVKSDVLAFLISNAGGAFVTSDLARAIAYSPRSVHRAVVELTDARFIRSFSGHPAEYVVEGKAWLELLEVPTQSPPAWRYWQQVFAFVAQLVSFRERLEPGRDTDFVASSHLRELTSQYGMALEWNRLPAPRSEMHAGTAFLKAFGEIASTLAEWMREET